MDQIKIIRHKVAAEMLGVEEQTLRAWRYRGMGPMYIRLGESKNSPVGYLLSDIEDWLTKRSFESTSQEAVQAHRSEKNFELRSAKSRDERLPDAYQPVS